VATKPKRQARYDLKAADRKRNLMIQIGLTAIVVVFAVALVLWIVMGGDKKPGAGEAKAVHVTTSKLVTKPGTSEPKATVSLYEDFLCPHCGSFEKQFGVTISRLIDAGAIGADYYMVGILDSSQNDDYSSRAGAAAYCVADQNLDAFRRFHTALFAMQPGETSTQFPTDAQLAETARQSGAGGNVAVCINSHRYVPMVKGLAKATGISATPTIKINGEDYQYSTPDALVAKIRDIVGNVPGLDQAAAPAPSAPAPAAPAPAAPAPAAPAAP
jgi:protein-disulfide isomerase